MIHMLSSFDLRPGEDFAEFAEAYAVFLQELYAAELIVDAGPLAKRVENTPMDTDQRDQRYFSTMTFRDRAQLDKAYAHIEARARPGTQTHLSMYRRLTNTVFLCWEDTDPTKETP